MSLTTSLRRFIAPLAQRVAMLSARVVVKLTDDSTGLQAAQVQCFRGELRDGVERMQPYGLTSVPHSGAEGLGIFINGNRDHGILVQVDDRRYRLRNLEQGEVAIYTDEGDRVHLKRGGHVEVHAASECSIHAPTTRITGDLVVAGSVEAQGSVEVVGTVAAGGDITALTATLPGSFGQLRSTYNVHVHGTSGPPNPQL